MEVLSRLSVFSLCFCLCYSQMSELAFQRDVDGSTSVYGSTSGMDRATNSQSSENTEITSKPSVDTSSNLVNSQSVTLTNTAFGGPGMNRVGTTFSGESITTPEPALKCTEEFKNLAGHTLCMTDNLGVRASGITPADKLMITDFHNDLRSRVMPPAEDLLKLKWDEKLAAVAGKWAKQCTVGHDKKNTIPDMGMSVGQNVAGGYQTWRRAIQAWYDEVQVFRYGIEPNSYLGPIGHYTQIVHNTTQLIGCGYAECPNTKYVRYYVCNYASGQVEIAFPYTAGTRCAKCPNNCNNGLCDCGDLVCYNRGKLDPSTCTCKCPKLYKGRSCETLDCPAKDKWVCGRDWPASYCKRYSNVKEVCPYMCGVCSGAVGTTQGIQPN